MEVDREKARGLLRQTLYDTYDCTRVWQGWDVGTMKADDFVPIWEDDDRLDEIVDAVLMAAIS